VCSLADHIVIVTVVSWMLWMKLIVMRWSFQWDVVFVTHVWPNSILKTHPQNMWAGDP